MTDTIVHVYEDAAHGWRWRKVAPNGKIVADGSESYTRRGDAVEAAQRENPGVAVKIDAEGDAE